MQKNIRHIIVILLVLATSSLYGQTVTTDSLLIKEYNDRLAQFQNYYDSIYHVNIREARLNYNKGYYTAKAEVLKLPHANDITDSFSLRLWITGMMGHKLITLERHNKVWESHKYSFKTTCELKEETFTPNITTNQLLEDLKLFDFKRMISQYEIPNFDDNISDGVTYILEVNGDEYFNIFIYHSPEYFALTEKNNKSFSDIIKLLDKYFLFK